MKVLWFTNTPVGAQEKLSGDPIYGGGWLNALSEELAKNPEIELHIAFYLNQEMSPFQWKGITYHPVKMDSSTTLHRIVWRDLNAYSDKLDRAALPHLRKIIDDVKPDLIHIHGSENNFGLIAESSLSCPVVLSIQGIISIYNFYFFRGYSKQEINSAETLRTRIIGNGTSTREIAFRRKGARERSFLKRIPNIIGRTFWDKAATLAINPQRRYFEVGEILRDVFYQSRWDKTHFTTPLVITSTLSIASYKGLEVVFQTSKILQEAGFSCQWNVIGYGPDDQMTRLCEKKVGHGAKSLNIQMLGFKNAQEMVSILQDTDLFVQVSHIENSPNSLCEAMLMGIPCIASFAGGTASILENNVEGRLVQDGDPYTLAGMIMEMASDFESAKKMGDRAHDTAVKRHNPIFVCNQLLNVYNTLLSEC